MDKYLALVKLESSGENLVLTGDRAKLLAPSSSGEQVPIPVIIPVHTIDQTFFSRLDWLKKLIVELGRWTFMYSKRKIKIELY